MNQSINFHNNSLSQPKIQYSPTKKSYIKYRSVDNYQTIAKLPNPIYAFMNTLFAHPHLLQDSHNLQSSQFENKEQTEVKDVLQSDSDFLVSCENGTEDVYLKYIQTKKNETITFKQNLGNKKIVNIGSNIIHFRDTYMYKQLTQPFQIKYSQEITIRGDFQSGNFSYSMEVDNQFLIILNNDTNTQGYTQWFQFLIKGSSNWLADHQFLKFTIINIRKPIKYLSQMKLLTKSFDENPSSCWKRNLHFAFYETKMCDKQNRKYFALSFSLHRQQIERGIFVSLSHPYPYQRLQELLNYVKLKNKFKVYEIGKTSLGNPLIMFNLANFGRSRKKNIFILSRQHSSQTSSSFICQFIIKMLEANPMWDELVKLCNWHIIPISNPDGVIHGNSRVNIAGYDINRCWAQYLLYRSAQAMAINRYIQKLECSPDDIFIDLHSHSRQLGLFSYVNNQNQFLKQFNEKMSENCQFFEKQKCRVGEILQKKSTFRVQMQYRFKIQNIVTLQTSFYGYIDKNTKQLKSFDLQDYKLISTAILKCLKVYLIREPYPKIDSCEPFTKQIVILESVKQKDEKKDSRMDNVGNDSMDESDPDPEGDYLNEKDRKQVEYRYSNQFAKVSSEHDKQVFFKQTEKCQKLSGLKKKSIDLINYIRASKRIKSEQNAVNLYQVSKKVITSERSKDKRRVLTAKNEKIHSNRSVDNNIIKRGHKAERQISVNVPHFDNFTSNLKKQSKVPVTRKSFRSLFDSAQLRQTNSLSSKRTLVIRCDGEQQEPKQFEKSKGQKKLLDNKSLEKYKKCQTIKNVIFPFETLTLQNENMSQIKYLQQLIEKRNQKPIKSFYFEKKSKLFYNEKDKINEKITLLCEYVKKISS